MNARAGAASLAVILATAARAAQAQPPPQPPEERFSFGGWVRSSLEAGLAEVGGAPDPLAVPYDRIVAREQLLLRQRYARGRSFEAVVSGLLTYDVFGQEAPSDTRTAFAAALREAWLGFYGGSVDFRVGNQRLAWGQTEFFPVNDVANARDIRDPVLTETELRWEPTFLLRGDVALGPATLQVSVAPFFRPDRYDVYGTNWAFVQPDAPASYRGLLGALTRDASLSPEDAGEVLFPGRGTPEDDLSGVEAGVRLDWRWGRFALSHYYHQGYHGIPDFQVSPALDGALDAIDWSTVSPEEVRLLLAQIAGSGAVTTEWPRRHHFGLGVNTTAGSLTLRLDAAYEHEGLFYDRRLHGFRSPAGQVALGVELPATDPGRALIVELFHQWIDRAPPPGGLLYTEQQTTALGVLFRRTWRDRVEFELRAVAGLSPGSVLVRPQVAWKKDALAVRLGAVLPGGEELSYGDWFGRNQAVYVMLKRSF